MTDELWRWDAVDVADGVAKRDVSSREVVTSCLRRLEDVNPKLNAVVHVLADEALDTAAAADEAVQRGDPLGPLHGVPVTVKVNVDTKGCATTNGVVAFKDLIAPDDSPPVANWRRAGAVVIGRTNTPCFSWRWFTDNALHGRTLNPWDADVTPGGSSGGAAASLASGIGPLAHGNDIGGSVRYPAYACGVVGIRPTLGRVPAYNPSATVERSIMSQLMSTQGPLARRIRDLRVGLHAMVARDPWDPWWVPAPLEHQPSEQATRVALFSELDGTEAHPAVADALRRAADWLEGAGYVVEEKAPPRFREAAELWLALLMTDARRDTLAAIEQYGDEQIRSSAKAMLEHVPQLDLFGFLERQARRATILREWMLFFESYPLILMPVSWQPPFPQDLDLQGPEVMGQILDAQSPQLALPLLGLPGVSVPTGVEGRVPMGVQLAAGRYREDLCLAAAPVIEDNAALATPIDPRF